MLSKIVAVLRGLVFNPVLVAFARGLVESLVFLALYSIADFVVTLPDVSPVILLLLPTVVRTSEGYIDHIDPAKKRRRDALRASPLTDEDGNPVADPQSYANGDMV